MPRRPSSAGMKPAWGRRVMSRGALSDFEVGANGREHRLRDSPVAERRQVQAVDADVGVHVRQQGAEQVDQHRAFAARDLAQSIVDELERGPRDLRSARVCPGPACR